VGFANGKERVNHSGALGGFVRAGKQVVFSAQGHRADCILDQIIVNFQYPVIQITTELFPSANAVVHRFTNLTFRENLLGLLTDPLAHLVDDRQ
jgi:hypothetical protein